MLSFIIIGRNEGWKLSKCITSVFETINKNSLESFEVLYIDSQSTDDSIKRVKKYKNVRIILLTGDYNAAIARNVGALESKGNVLFFIDGDMEIMPEFLPLVYNEKSGLNYNYSFVSGQFINYYYNDTGELERKQNYHNFKENENEKKEFTTGGLFLIKKSYWNLVKGMKNKLRRNQDIEFALRLAKHRIFLIRRKEIIAIHHTISYHNQSRMWNDLFHGNELYRSVLLRDNFFNLYQWKHFIRENYSSICLFIIILLTIITFNYYYLLLYLILIILRVLLNNKQNIGFMFSRIIYFIIRDIHTWLSLLFYWPLKKRNINYIKVR